MKSDYQYSRGRIDLPIDPAAIKTFSVQDSIGMFFGGVVFDCVEFCGTGPGEGDGEFID